MKSHRCCPYKLEKSPVLSSSLSLALQPSKRATSEAGKSPKADNLPSHLT